MLVMMYYISSVWTNHGHTKKRELFFKIIYSIKQTLAENKPEHVQNF